LAGRFTEIIRQVDTEPFRPIHSPWQRGTNENTNGLIRGFFPKGTDFNLVTKEKLNWVQNALNERPRQTLEFNTPKETFNSLLLKY
jgi:IS30 family transposase